ncbi:OmpA family protein [Emticicia sp. SJ17W-69]|uniref:OmpA family protein n=1 Tax=Emticicia sp. SJ17W-69 TaxID=3421657 RepID=UPI003EB81D5C
MKLLRILFFVFINSLVFSQTSFRSKLTVSPHIGIGWAIPPFITGGNSNLILQPNYFKNGLINVIGTSSGNSRRVFKITNTFGIDVNYSINKTWSLNIGINRALHINILNDPDPIRVSSTTQYSKWLFANKYTSLLLGARYTHNWQFFQCNIHYAGDTKAVSENNNGTGGRGLITNGNGLITTNISKKSNTIIISPEYGVTGVSSFDLPMELSVGLHIPTSVFSKDKSTFIRNNTNAGENTLRFTQAALWLRVRVPITIWTKNTRKAKQPLVNDNKPIPIPNKSVEYEGKKMITGEKVILKNIQFEQSKAVITSIAMNELDNVQKLMEQSPSMVIEIIGHTSDEGDRNSNIELSLNRAKACKAYLVKKGIRSNRIQVRGMGPDSPISKTDKSQNRRVEMQIISM